MKVPVDIFASAPNQLSMVVHTQNGRQRYDLRRQPRVDCCRRQIDARAAADRRRSRGRADGCAALVPARIKQDLQWRTGFPSVSIDDQAGPDRPERGARAARRQAVFRQSNLGCSCGRCAMSTPRSASFRCAVDYSDYRPIAGVEDSVPPGLDLDGRAVDDTSLSDGAAERPYGGRHSSRYRRRRAAASGHAVTLTANNEWASYQDRGIRNQHQFSSGRKHTMRLRLGRRGDSVSVSASVCASSGVRAPWLQRRVRRNQVHGPEGHAQWSLLGKPARLSSDGRRRCQRRRRCSGTSR